ncbi:hypothetical protein [Sulfuriferula thiophila]|uniref:hypothetical protein n=1 Tax=Sulfuriferula thiophila TaxID=1781211 RepID=UPI000F60C5FE|nr:hypothetical protein [Sulfuriferula thiophila]
MFKIELPDYMPTKNEWGANKKTALFVVKFGAKLTLQVALLLAFFPLYMLKYFLLLISKR